MKYVVVSGGVISGIGKGITSSSIGVVLKECGLAVTSIKIDPYLNIDAGLMSPYEHGEVYVLDDGGESDLDLGNYERFLQCTLTRDHNITTGKIYKEVIDKERKGDYLGKTVQVVPHATNAIQDWITRVAMIPVDNNDPDRVPDVCVIELGGTVGDIESMVFLEALRQLQHRVGEHNMCHVHVSLIPKVGPDGGEQKSKPTQHAVRELRAAGLSPDIIVCRCSEPVSREIISKVSMFCMVSSSHVVSIHNVSNIYHVPPLLISQRMPGLLLGCLKINRMPPERLPLWENLCQKLESASKVVRIAIVGKYTGLTDSYLSVTKALLHASIEANLKLEIEWTDSSQLELSTKVSDPEGWKAAWHQLRTVDGVLIPGGFGSRGCEGKILCCKYVRQNNIPFLGICLGMQMAVIEYMRNVVGKPGAHSQELAENSEHPVIMYMPEIDRTKMGANMRLGARASRLKERTLAYSLYQGGKNGVIMERHRHRYEVNPGYVKEIEEAGLVFSAKDAEQGVRMEIIELPTHRFFLATQYHPEYKSSPFAPSPVFRGFIRAAGGLASDPPAPSAQASRAPTPTNIKAAAE